MKKVLAIAVLLLLATVAMASQTNWMWYVQAGSPGGMDEGVYNQIGVKPTSVDAADTYDPVYDYATAGGSEKVASQVIGAATTTVYQRNYLQQFNPAVVSKVWSFRVAGLAGATNANGGIQLKFRTGTSSLLAAPVGSPTTFKWVIRLKNPQGMVIPKPAWAGGGTWADEQALDLIVPATTNTVFAIIDLPFLKLPGSTAQNMVDLGYAFEVENVIPEPGSLMILGTGLAGLVGFVTRKRK